MNISSRVQYLKNILYDRGVIKGSRDYTPFIMLGMGRTGSNMLASALRNHDNVIAFGEIFNNADKNVARILWEYPGYRSNAAGVALRDEAPADFLDRMVYRGMPGGIGAVGFKLFYYHCRDSWQSVWDHLRENDRLHVLHIKRRNKLETMVSMHTALKTRQWSVTKNKGQDGGTPSREKFVMDPEECRKGFEQIRSWETEYDAMFEDKPRLDVAYEDMVDDFRGTMAGVFDFLGVPRMEVQPMTLKQRKAGLAEILENFDQLADHFRGTEWEVHFTV